MSFENITFQTSDPVCQKGNVLLVSSRPFFAVFSNNAFLAVLAVLYHSPLTVAIAQGKEYGSC
jgi:hypothetical protein